MRASALTGDPARSRATSRPALSAIAISASASAALSVRTESAQSWRAAASIIRPITRSAAGGVTYTLTSGCVRAALERGDLRHASPASARLTSDTRSTVALIAVMPKIVRMNLLRRHPIAFVLLALVVVSAIDPLPALVDAATGAPPADADLARPLGYVAAAPLSDVLDALTFLSLDRARALLAVWAVALAAWGALRPAAPRRRAVRALLGPVALLALGGATVTLPRSVPRLVTSDSALTVIDYHAHTSASHDGRRGWTALDLARWHAAQGFEASYVTEHNLLFDQRVQQPIPLLPGVEWSVAGQHIVALADTLPVDRGRFGRDTRSLLGLFGELHRHGALSIASLPEYWLAHWDDLDEFVAAGLDGFEIVNCAPKALAFPAARRGQVLALAAARDLLVVGASDNHGWGKVTCVWNLALSGVRGYRSNQVVARPLALAQGEWLPWTAAYTQPWLMFRGLSWSERCSWITWVLVVLIYRAVPRRAGDAGGLGILARSLEVFKLRWPRKPTTPGP